MELATNTEWGAILLIVAGAYYVFTHPEQCEKWF